MQNQYEVQYNSNPDFRSNPFETLGQAKADRQNRVERESKFDPQADSKFTINQLDRSGRQIDRVDI